LFHKARKKSSSRTNRGQLDALSLEYC
jgi:hypothetical protein